MSYKSINCPFCKDSFKQEAKFRVHLKNQHSINDIEKCYVDTILDGTKPTCACSTSCLMPTKWSGWKNGYMSKYVKGHNASVDSVYLSKDFQKAAAEKRKEGFATGKYDVWNKGLSKETDARVSDISQKISVTINKGYESGKITDWRLQDKEKALSAAKKISETKKALFASGKLKSWNQGLTKGSDGRLTVASKKISENYESREAGRRLTIEELSARIMRLENFELLTPVENYRSKYGQTLEFKCVNCNSIIQKTLGAMESTPVCFTCNPKSIGSMGQNELYNFVLSLTNDAIANDRAVISPLEIDVHVPSKLCIEYDGLYWHSELFKEQNYASRKLNAVHATGTPFLSIFEDEWRDKRPIVESMIRHRLGLNSAVIGARKCSVVKLTSQQRSQFFSANHIDGDVLSTVAFGLEHESKIIAALSLRKPFHKKYEGAIEVARFSVSCNVSVPGALSRLLHAAKKWSTENGYSQIMTYVDRRIGEAKGYIKAGFKVVETKQIPRFWWTDFERRYDRFQFKADSKNNLTESQVAANASVTKIWGCSNILLLL